MKRLPQLLLCLLACVSAVPAMADGRGHGGWHGGGGGYVNHYNGGYNGGHHGGGYGYRGGWNGNWVGPVVGAALLGGAIYAASTPSYAVPQTVVVQQQYAPPSRVAYFCPTAQQYYPNVPTCQVPWQVVNY